MAFRYKDEIDPTHTRQFGLVAEDVEQVSPALVLHDKEGKLYSVRYDQVNAMLLNEFLKDHRKMQSLETAVAELKNTKAQEENTISELGHEVHALTAHLKAQAAQIEHLSAQVQSNNAASRVALNNR